jgi:2-polyprenyl-6-methoxyphenol hydroxylase-like FAD-dependent oxidoreductase
MASRHAIVVGAGIGGLTAAVALRRQGWDVTVLERAPALEPVGAGLGLGPNALHALDAIGLGEDVRRFSAVQGHGGLRRSGGGWLVRTDLGVLATRFGDPQLVALRADLVGLLAGRLPPGTLRTGVTVTGVDAGDTDRKARVRTSAGDLDAELVVAADGIGSRLRALLFPDHPGPRYSGFTTWRFVAPALPPGASRAEPAETWGRGEVFGVLPLADGQVYCYASAPAPPGVRHDDEASELKRRFGRWHDPIPGLIGTVSADRVLHDDVYWIADPLPAARRPRAGPRRLHLRPDAPDPDGSGRLLPGHPAERHDLPARHRPAEHRDPPRRPPRSRPDDPPARPDSLLDTPAQSRPHAVGPG